MRGRLTARVALKVIPCLFMLYEEILGLSERDLGSASDADRGSDSKTTLPPNGLDLDPNCVLCCLTVREIQSSSAIMRVVCVPCGALAQPH